MPKSLQDKFQCWMCEQLKNGQYQDILIQIKMGKEIRAPVCKDCWESTFRKKEKLK